MAAPESKSAAQQLLDLYHLVHLLYHRNKNQHRRSLWWRHLNAFRRDLRILSAAAPPADDPPAVLPQPLSLPLSFEPLLRRWARDRVPHWHAAFSRILAERRFVAIGLVLLAALAQAVDILGVRTMMEEEARGLSSAGEAAMAEPAVETLQGVDLGVIVDRGTIEEEDVVAEKKPEGKRKKRRKGNVIDDLFDELG
jgi:hypothetical protein